MKHPSIRFRLMLGSALLVAGILIFSKVVLYREIERSLRSGLDDQLLHSAALISKSTELQAGGVIYEWQEAGESVGGREVEGFFQLWDLKGNRTTRSPDLGKSDLEFFHGEMDEPLFRNIVLPDGKSARAIGLLHLPFLNDYGYDEMKRRGTVLQPADFPQVLVYASETGSLEAGLAQTRTDLLWSGMLTLLAMWLAVFIITCWTLRPLEKLAAELLKRSSEIGTPLPEIPAKLPKELVPLASAFRVALGRVETARSNEKDFAISAAHQLRSPVAGVQAILEQAISRPRDAEELRSRVRRALNVVRGFRPTIDSLMQLARLKGGENLTRAPFDPVSVVEQSVMSESGRSDRGCLVDIVKPVVPAIVLGSEPLYRIVVSILVENAFSYTPVGGRIWIEMRLTGDAFILRVANEAPEFEPEDCERVFKPFQRGKNISVNSSGAGLGLALAREVASKMGATLELSFDRTGIIAFETKIPGASQASIGEKASGLTGF